MRRDFVCLSEISFHEFSFTLTCCVFIAFLSCSVDSMGIFSLPSPHILLSSREITCACMNTRRVFSPSGLTFFPYFLRLRLWRLVLFFPLQEKENKESRDSQPLSHSHSTGHQDTFSLLMTDSLTETACEKRETRR